MRHPGPTLRAAAALVALETLGLLAAALFYLVELVVATTTDVTRALVTAGLTLLTALGVGFVARGLWRRGRWARSPALVLNLILLPVGYGLLQGRVWGVGVPLLVLALGVLVLLFLPATSTDFTDGADPVD